MFASNNRRTRFLVLRGMYNILQLGHKLILKKYQIKIVVSCTYHKNIYTYFHFIRRLNKSQLKKRHIEQFDLQDILIIYIGFNNFLVKNIVCIDLMFRKFNATSYKNSFIKISFIKSTSSGVPQKRCSFSKSI